MPSSKTYPEGRLHMAFADPPYIGQSAKHYADHPDFAGEVDHGELIDRLVRDYPDGWALSASSPSLREILPLCPEDVRVMAWVKPFAAREAGLSLRTIADAVGLSTAGVHKIVGRDKPQQSQADLLKEVAGSTPAATRNREEERDA